MGGPKLQKSIFNNIRYAIKKNKHAYFFILPGILLVFIVIIYPVFMSINLSLSETHYLQRIRYVGTENFRRILSDPRTFRNLRNSFVYVFYTILFSIPLGLILALILNKKLIFRGVFRSIAIIPWVIAQIVTALLWRWILDPTFGPINYIFVEFLGFRYIDFLGNPSYAMPTLIFTNIWRSFPLPMILILAALQTVPNDLYEAAIIDGANAYQKFRYITIPLITSSILISLILTTIYSFNMVTLIYILTGGGPLGMTEVLSLRIYREGFQLFNLNTATAYGMIIFFINATLSLFYILVLKREY